MENKHTDDLGILEDSRKSDHDLKPLKRYRKNLETLMHQVKTMDDINIDAIIHKLKEYGKGNERTAELSQEIIRSLKDQSHMMSSFDDRPQAGTDESFDTQFLRQDITMTLDEIISNIKSEEDEQVFKGLISSKDSKISGIFMIITVILAIIGIILLLNSNVHNRILTTLFWILSVPSVLVNLISMVTPYSSILKSKINRWCVGLTFIGTILALVQFLM